MKTSPPRRRGRPPLDSEPLVDWHLHVPRRIHDAIDAAARTAGKTRSEYLRSIIETHIAEQDVA